MLNKLLDKLLNIYKQYFGHAGFKRYVLMARRFTPEIDSDKQRGKSLKNGFW